MQEEITISKSELVQKEQIPNLPFKNVIHIEPVTGLAEKLTEATKLGNIHHGKVAILFSDDNGLKRVETTVWASGGKYICLKGGIWLPISRIHDIRFI